MEKQEKIIEKIKKVLELSRNNPSEEEAKAAALKAQQLMVQYHISMVQVDDVQDIENIVEETVKVGGGKKWKYQLANIVANNFRCKTFYYGANWVVFYGYATDAKIAADVFQYLFKVGNRAADTYYHQLRWDALDNGKYFDGRGVANSFLMGYMRGIKDALDKQCTALMIVVPQEVKDGFAERTSSSRSINSSLNTASYYSHEARQAGYEKGRSTMQARQLEEKAG